MRLHSACQTKQRIRATVLAVLLLVPLARLAFAMVYREGDLNPSGRMTSWSRIALNLASGKGYVYDRNEPTARRGPVPVLFLSLLFSLLGEHAFPVAIVVSQWLWDMGTAMLTYLIAMEVYGRRYVALLAMALFALHPVLIENSVRVNVEPLATFLLLAFALTLLRALRDPAWHRFIWPGLWLGLSILSLSVLQFYPLLAMGLIVAHAMKERARALLRIAMFCLALCTVWLPWILRNYLALGEFIPASTLGGHNLLKNHQTLGEADYLRFRLPSEDEVNKDRLFAAQGVDLSSLSETAQDRLYRGTAVGFIRAYPERYVVLSLVRFFRLWFDLGLGLGFSRSSLTATLVNGPLMILALVSYLCFRNGWIGRSLLLPTLLIYSTVLYMAIAAELRYSTPFTPLMIILGAYSTVQIAARLSLASRLGWTRHRPSQ